MKKFLQITILFFCVCFVGLISSQDLAAQTTWTGKVSSDWNNAGNWTAGVPNTSTDVIIPANCTTYPVLTSGNACRNIYMEAGARMQNQHLLTYTKAFVDISVNTNRYVRITPPLKETYSGDFFTKEQGGEWSEFTPAQYKPTDGPNGKNRIHPGGTYQSLFSETSTQRGNYGETAVSTFTSGWADPKNALNTKYKALQALDVWVDTKEDGVATFHFPSQETTYYYYDQNGKKQSFGETTPRTAESGRFVYDNAYANGVMDISMLRFEKPEQNVNMFALGNPAMAYLDIAAFLYINSSEQANTTPYVYRHNEQSLGRGNESILYYKDHTLYVIDNTSSQVTSSNEKYYVAPAHGFHVVNLPTEKLAGEYSCTYSCPEIKLYRRKYEYRFSWGYKWEWKFSHATVPASTESHTLTIKPNENNPSQVILINFAGKGTSINATVKPTDENHGTITIKNGTDISYVNNDWYNGNKNLYIYGSNSKSPVLTPTSTFSEGNYTQGAQYVFTGMPNESWQAERDCYDYYTQYATELNNNVVITYTITDKGQIDLALKNGFAIYNPELQSGDLSNVIKKKGYFDGDGYGVDDNNNTNRGNLVAWWVYNDMTGTQTRRTLPNELTEEVDFILPEALGTYTSDVKRAEKSVSIYYSLPDGVEANCKTYSNRTETFEADGTATITLLPVEGSYDQVDIFGFYPGSTESIKGKISKSGASYYLTIASRQLVKRNGGNQDYYFHADESGNLKDQLKLTWDVANKKWYTVTSESWSVQISYLNQDPKGDKQGFFWRTGTSAWPPYPTAVYLQKEPDTEQNVPTTYPEVTSLSLRFTPDMFKANPTITSGASLAPRRQGQKDTVASPIVNIRATGEGVSGNTLIVVDSTARNDYSMAEDAPLFDVQDYAFCLATLAGEQVVGVNVVSEPDIIPLYIQSQEQMLTLHFENIEALGGEVELYDAFMEDSVLITPGSCSVDIDLLDSEEAGRFFLRRRVSQAPTLPEGPATELPAVKETALQAWSPMKGVAVVHAGNTEKDAQIYVIDMNGRIVHQAPVVPLHTVRGLYTGTYVIKVGTPTDYQEVKLLVE
ncbi:MAG: T9SS type A sorting domain-containing protein [Paludibacteraceae bacterium]|nr:T9SS type A sorting domain-containing protein [Paludibacteraceae bacterium]